MEHWHECPHHNCAICGPLASNRLDQLNMDEEDIRLWMEYIGTNNNNIHHHDDEEELSTIEA